MSESCDCPIVEGLGKTHSYECIRVPKVRYAPRVPRIPGQNYVRVFEVPAVEMESAVNKLFMDIEQGGFKVVNTKYFYYQELGIERCRVIVQYRM